MFLFAVLAHCALEMLSVVYGGKRTTEGDARSGVCVYDSLREGVVWGWLVDICMVQDGSFPKRRVHGFGPWWALNRRPRTSADVNNTVCHFVNKLLDGRR